MQQGQETQKRPHTVWVAQQSHKDDPDFMYHLLSPNVPCVSGTHRIRLQMAECAAHLDYCVDVMEAAGYRVQPFGQTCSCANLGICTIFPQPMSQGTALLLRSSFSLLLFDSMGQSSTHLPTLRFKESAILFIGKRFYECIGYQESLRVHQVILIAPSKWSFIVKRVKTGPCRRDC